MGPKLQLMGAMEILDYESLTIMQNRVVLFCNIIIVSRAEQLCHEGMCLSSPVLTTHDQHGIIYKLQAFWAIKLTLAALNYRPVSKILLDPHMHNMGAMPTLDILLASSVPRVSKLVLFIPVLSVTFNTHVKNVTCVRCITECELWDIRIDKK